MAITNFIPEVWAAQILSILQKSLVFAGGNAVNRDYEGDIASFGDTVHIISIADPTIRDYVKDTDITIEVLTDADRTLVINQQKYFGFEIDDIDLRQARSGGALMSEAAMRAAFRLRDVADQYLAATMVAGSTDTLAVPVLTTSTDVYDKLLIPMRVALDTNNVPLDGRWIVLEPALYGKILGDTRFIHANESADGGSALHNGVVGRAAGFDILTSNNSAAASITITNGRLGSRFFNSVRSHRSRPKMRTRISGVTSG